MIQDWTTRYANGFYLMPGATFETSVTGDIATPTGPSGLAYIRRVRGRREIGLLSLLLLLLL